MHQDGHRIIFLTGAPLSCTLEWTEESLCSPLQSCYTECKNTDNAVPSSETTRPNWRALPLEARYLPSGFAQDIEAEGHHEEELSQGNETSFLTVTEISTISDDDEGPLGRGSQSSGKSTDEVLTQFYEQSYALHEEIDLSDAITLDSMNVNDLSSVIDSEEIQRPGRRLSGVPPTKPRSINITSLENIPNAAMIRELGVSTMSVDLLVGIISISAPRTVRTRKFGRMVELVEMIVADNTKAGFGITIWLPEATSQANTLRSSITRLRPRDVVLTRNVALNTFKGKVYGQSLRKGITKADLLYRYLMDSHDEPGAYTLAELDSNVEDSQMMRVREVRDWIKSFIGADQELPADDRKYLRHTTRKVQLPADTQ